MAFLVFSKDSFSVHTERGKFSLLFYSLISPLVRCSLSSLSPWTCAHFGRPSPKPLIWGIFNAFQRQVKVKSLSHVWLLATSWTVAHQAPPSMGFSRQEYWSEVPLPSLFKVLRNRISRATSQVLKKSLGEKTETHLTLNPTCTPRPALHSPTFSEGQDVS